MANPDPRCLPLVEVDFDQNSETFRQRFERGYRDAGGELPEDWLRTARLLDSTLIVATLNEERELPAVFAELCELIEVIIAEGV